MLKAAFSNKCLSWMMVFNCHKTFKKEREATASKKGLCSTIWKVIHKEFVPLEQTVNAQLLWPMPTTLTTSSTSPLHPSKDCYQLDPPLRCQAILSWRLRSLWPRKIFQPYHSLHTAHTSPKQFSDHSRCHNEVSSKYPRKGKYVQWKTCWDSCMASNGIYFEDF